jgi:hypothetical protein
MSDPQDEKKAELFASAQRGLWPARTMRLTRELGSLAEAEAIMAKIHATGERTGLGAGAVWLALSVWLQFAPRVRGVHGGRHLVAAIVEFLESIT